MNVCSGTALSFMDKKLYKEVIEEAKKAYDVVVNKTGKGNEFLGWVNLPNDYDKDEFDRIKKTAEKIKSNSDVLLVIGIGGSYLGAKAAIEGLSRYFNRDGIEIIFVGNSMSSTYIQDLIDYLENKDVIWNDCKLNIEENFEGEMIYTAELEDEEGNILVIDGYMEDLKDYIVGVKIINYEELKEK